MTLHVSMHSMDAVAVRKMKTDALNGVLMKSLHSWLSHLRYLEWSLLSA